MRREVGHVHQLTGESDHPESDPEAEQGGHDRQAHRDERAEADEQDDYRRADAHGRGEPDRRPLRLLDRLAAELDLERRRARGPGCRDHVLDGRLRQHVGALVEGDRREADRAVTRDRSRTGAVRADHGGHARHVRHAGEGRADRRALALIGQLAGACAEDDLIRISRLGREATLEEVDGTLRAGAREREVAGGLRPYRVRDRVHPYRGRDPQQNDDAAMGHGPAGNSEHQRPVLH